MSGYNRTTALLLGWVFLVLVVAYAYLEVNGKSTAGLLVLGGPLLGSFYLDRQMSQRLAPVEAKLDTTVAQTNGMLTDGIRRHAEDAATAAIVKAGLITPNAPYAAQHAEDRPPG